MHPNLTRRLNEYIVNHIVRDTGVAVVQMDTRTVPVSMRLPWVNDFDSSYSDMVDTIGLLVTGNYMPNRSMQLHYILQHRHDPRPFANHVVSSFMSDSRGWVHHNTRWCMTDAPARRGCLNTNITVKYLLVDCADDMCHEAYRLTLSIIYNIIHLRATSVLTIATLGNIGRMRVSKWYRFAIPVAGTLPVMDVNIGLCRFRPAGKTMRWCFHHDPGRPHEGLLEFESDANAREKDIHFLNYTAGSGLHGNAHAVLTGCPPGQREVYFHVITSYWVIDDHLPNNEDRSELTISVGRMRDIYVFIYHLVDSNGCTLSDTRTPLYVE
jgi:hypothetical protein